MKRGPEAHPSVLFIGSFEDGSSVWNQLLESVAGAGQRVRSRREAEALLLQNPVASVAAMRDPPAVIVISRLADERLWLEVLNAGGYDVPARPLDVREAKRTIALACQRRPQNPIAGPLRMQKGACHV